MDAPQIVLEGESIFLGFNLPPNKVAVPPHPSFELQTPLSRDYYPSKAICLTRWWDEKMPYLPFMFPMGGIRYDGPLLGRLREPVMGFPLEQVDGKWRLVSHIAESWLVLENTLQEGSTALIHAAGYYFHTEFHRLQLPSQLGFRFSFKSRSSALIRIRESRDSFVALIGYFSWAISLHKEDFNWKTAMSVSIKPEVWVDWLRQSCVCNFQILRVGTIIEPSSYECIKAAQQLIALNVPVWIHWGPTLQPRREITKDFPPVWVPTQVALDKARYVPATALDGDAMADFGTVDDGEYTRVTEYPTPSPGSGQKRGESMEDFFARREQQNVAILANETIQQRKTRTNLETQSRLCPKPGEGRSKMKVFVWLPQPDYSNFLLRTKIPSSELVDTWLEAPNSYKRYDGYRNEWDIDHSFHVRDNQANGLFIQDLMDEEDDDDGPIMIGVRQPVAPLHERAVHERAVLQEIEDLTVAVGEGSSEADSVRAAIIHGRPNFVVLCQLMFGFEWESAPVVQGETSDVLLTRCQKALGEFQTALGAAGAHLLLTRFLMAHIEETTIPPTIHDLKPQCARPLVLQRYSIESYRNGSVKVYFLSHESKPHWRLAFWSSSAAVRCIRSTDQCGSFRQIVQWLVKWGIEFRTVLRLPFEPRALYHPPEDGLGYRAKGYKGSLIDYLAYRKVVESLVTSRSRRSFITCGSLVWRLVVDVLGFEDAVDDVLDGPSETPLTRFRTRAGLLCDDSCSTSDMNAICGVYFVLCNRTNNQSSDSSWWPKQAVFESSGLWPGYWSNNCEIWYQKRRQQLSSDPCGQLRTSTQWREVIRYYAKDLRPLQASSDHEATGYLRVNMVQEI